MSILVEGTLLSPAGHVIGNADIVLTSISTSLVVLGGTPLSVQTDFEGRYSFTLNNGNFAVSVSKDGNNWFSGMITVTDLTVPKSINALILQDAMMAEIPTDYWSYFQSQTGILFNSFGKIDDAVKVTKEASESSLDSRDRAEVAAYRAEQAEVKSDSKTYYITPADPDGTMAGLENTTNGDYFRVSQGLGNDISFIYYRNENGSAVKDTDYPSGTAVNKVVDAIKYDKNGPTFSFRDESGAVFFDGDNSGGYGTPEVRFENNRLFNDSFEIIPNEIGALAIQDEQGAIEVLSAGIVQDSGNTPEPEIESLIERDNKNKAASLLRKSKKIPYDIASCVWDYIIIFVYGQSLGSGMECWPVLSKVAREIGNLLMVGDSVRGNSRTGPYVPQGDNVFNNLHAVVQSTDQPTRIYTDEEVSLLAAGNLSEGEGVDVSAVQFWRALQLQLNGLPSNPNRKIVVVNCAVAGRSVEELSPGASTRHYEDRLVPALQNIKNLVDAKSIDEGTQLTCGILCGIYIGNEWNYLGTRGTTDKTEYKNILGGLYDSISGLNKTIFNVEQRPFFVSTQTGDIYTRDSTNLSIGMAHIEMSNERDDVFCAGPNYPAPSKMSGHRTTNGSRMLGQKIGQVIHTVADLRHDWFPMQVIGATYSGSEVLVDNLVPEFPIVFNETFNGLTPTLYQSKGYRIEDAIGDPIITRVDIAADTIVKINVNRELVPPVFVWYAGEKTYMGDGNLYDSDKTLALYNYEYTQGTGQYPAENLVDYINKPYPMNNACAAFKIEAIKND